MANFSSDAIQSARQDDCDLSWHCDALAEENCGALQEEWAGLAEAASEKNIFQFPRFVLGSLPLLWELRPKIVTIRQGALLIGIVILHRDVGYGKLPVPFWRSSLHHEQFLGTPLVRAGYEEAFAAGLCSWLDNAPRDYFFLKLSKVSADGAIARAITDYCRSDGRQLLTANCHERAAISPKAQEGAEAEDLLSSGRRKSILKARKRLMKEGHVTLEHLIDTTQVADWTSQFLAMEDTGWKRENKSSILSCKRETALYEGVIKEAFAAQNLHFSRLCLDGAPIAYTLDIVVPPTGYCLKSAIDQRYRKFSPGVLMEYETLKHYLGKEEFSQVDSCSAPDNSMLNQLWPDRKAIADFAIARKGAPYAIVFRCIRGVKRLIAPTTGV